MMAIWQFVFDLVPASAATISGVVAARMSCDQLEAIKLNFSEATSTAFAEGVGAILPEKQSWAPSLRIWGDEKSDDIQIVFDGAAIVEAQFRLDVTNLSMSLVNDFCALARTFDCVFATSAGAIIRPYSEALIRAVMRSDAVGYVTDPERYPREAIKNDPTYE